MEAEQTRMVCIKIIVVYYVFCICKMKRKAEESSQRSKRQKTLMETIRKKTNLNTIVTEISRKMGIDRNGKLIQALNDLDKRFSEENWKKVEEMLEGLELTKMNFKTVKKFDTRNLSDIQIMRGTRVAQATSKVLLDCMYQGKECVVKVMEASVDKVELFMESLINIFVSAVTKKNESISSPDVITMGFVKGLPEYSSSSLSSKNQKKQLILIQEKVNAKEFKNLQEDELRKALIILCKGLKKLQEEYNFAHRDFHCGNVMYSQWESQVYIIDFGYSCFSLTTTNKGSLQTHEGGYGYDQFDEDYRSHIKCVNRSHDLCVLLLSLAIQFEDIQWLQVLAEEISKKYQNMVIKTDGWEYQDKNVNRLYKKYTFDQPIIHYWYVYEMFDIDIGMGPDEILTLLEPLKKKYNLKL